MDFKLVKVKDMFATQGAFAKVLQLHIYKSLIYTVFFPFKLWCCFIYDHFAVNTLHKHWAIPEKHQTWGSRTYFFKTPIRILKFFTLPLEIPDKIKFHS